MKMENVGVDLVMLITFYVFHLCGSSTQSTVINIYKPIQQPSHNKHAYPLSHANNSEKAIRSLSKIKRQIPHY